MSPCSGALQVSLYAHFAHKKELPRQQDTAGTMEQKSDISAESTVVESPRVSDSVGVHELSKQLISLDNPAARRTHADSDFLKFLKYSNFVSLEVVSDDT